jgi:hypothetical protein
MVKFWQTVVAVTGLYLAVVVDVMDPPCACL